MNWQDHVAIGWDLLSWEGESQWFAKKNDQRLGGRIKSPEQLMGTVRNAEALGWDLYLQLNPSRRAGHKVKLSREDITHWRYLLLDLDPGEDCLTPPEFNRVANRIYSGRGFQMWVPVRGMPTGILDWRYNVEGNDSKYERIMAGYIRYHRNKPWTNGWIADTSCADLARVVRCPGSINQKTGKRAEVEFHEGLGKNIWELEVLAAPETEPVVVPLEKCTNLSDVLPHLTVTARRFILDGVETPGRHSAAFHTATLLKELGVPYDRAYNWIMNGAGLCRPTDRQLKSDCLNTLWRVYGV